MSQAEQQQLEEQEKQVGIDHLSIGERVCLVVGIFVILFSELCLGKKPTIPNKVSNFKALQEISFKESHLNVAMNTNSLSCTLVGMMFLIFSCLMQFFKNLRIVTELSIDYIRILEILMGVSTFTVAILILFNVLQEKSAFVRIVHNRVGKNYKTAMMAITGVFALYCLMACILFYNNSADEQKVLNQSYIQLLIASVLYGLTWILYQEIFLKTSDG